MATIKLSRTQWEAIGKMAGWGAEDLDKNTVYVGKINSLAEAQKTCQEKFNKLPLVGYEIIIDAGLVKIKEKALGSAGATTEQQYKYKTYLQNNSGQFRVWTWVDVSPSLS